MNNEKRLSAGYMVSLYYQIVREALEGHFSTYNEDALFDDSIPTSKMYKDLEMYRTSLTSSELKNVKIRFVVESLLYDGKSRTIDEISAFTFVANQLNKFVPTISSSSIQRYLHNPYVRAKYGDEKAKEIEQMLEYNYVLGKSEGGKQFAKNNDATRSDGGEFNGSTPRTTPYVAPTYTKLVEEQARLFLSGKTYEEIAEMYTESLGHLVTATDVKRKLTIDLRKVNKDLYKEVENYKQQLRQEVLNAEKEKLLNVYDLYIEKGLTYQEIADLYKTSISSISRLLGARMIDMAKKFPEDITQEMIETVKERRKLNESGIRATTR